MMLGAPLWTETTMPEGNGAAPVVRTLLYVAVIGSLVLILLPGEASDLTGDAAMPGAGALQVIGALLTLIGVALALWCAGIFAVIGRGTPLPFDPPRRLVITGPYRWVRNPMAIGAGLALMGAGVYYESLTFLAFSGLFLLFIHGFVVLYEEPTLRRVFGAEYEAYCVKVRRWLPHRTGSYLVEDDSGKAVD